MRDQVNKNNHCTYLTPIDCEFHFTETTKVLSTKQYCKLKQTRP